jgi:hypothetical protein
MPWGCRMLWNFFGSSHEKGEHDGVGNIAKSEFQKGQMRLNAIPLWNAYNVVKFLRYVFVKEYIGLGSSRADVM